MSTGETDSMDIEVSSNKSKLFGQETLSSSP